MRKAFYIFISLFISLSLQLATFASNAHKIAVFPVDVAVYGSSISIYPGSIKMIAGDVFNELWKVSKINHIDNISTIDTLAGTGLDKEYTKFLKNYKSSYTLDYPTLSKIATKLGVNKIILISGGFDTQQVELKRTWGYNCFKSLPGAGLAGTLIPWATDVTPYYQFNVMVALVDTQSGTKLWEKTYSEYFKTNDLGIPTQYFGENVIPVKDLKAFSLKVSNEIAKNITEQILSDQYTNVNSKIISPDINYRESYPAKDGQTYPGSNDYLRENKKNDYIQWFKNQFN